MKCYPAGELAPSGVENLPRIIGFKSEKIRVLALRHLIKINLVEKILRKTRYFKIYSAFLEVSERGFFLTLLLVAFPISLFFRILENVVVFLEGIGSAIGMGEMLAALFSILIFIPSILGVLIVVDCLYVGLRAREQLLIGNAFHSKRFESRKIKFKKRILEE